MRIVLLLAGIAACEVATVPRGASSGARNNCPSTVTESHGFEHAYIVDDAISDAQEIVCSREFRDELNGWSLLHVSAEGGGTESGSAVYAAYSGADSNASALPVFIEPAGLMQRMENAFLFRDTATTSIKHTKSNVYFAVTRLYPSVLERYAAIPEGRACAINTLAHEWTHAILSKDHDQLFTDDGRRSPDRSIVSYTVGAIAQCVYLRRWRPMLDISSCVRAAGTYEFNACSCSAGWIDRFIAGETSCR